MINENYKTIDEIITKEGQDALIEMFDNCLNRSAYSIADKYLEQVKNTFVHYPIYRIILDGYIEK